MIYFFQQVRLFSLSLKKDCDHHPHGIDDLSLLI